MKKINREHFEAWLFGQPLDREFDYVDCQTCAMCAFARETMKVSGYVSASYRYLNVDHVLYATPDWMDGTGSKLRVLSIRDDSKLLVKTMQETYLKLFPNTIKYIEHPIDNPTTNLHPVNTVGVNS